MGVDHLFVDEAHLFKNLSFITKMQRVKGLSQGDSQRAEGLYMKIKWLEQNRPGRAAVFATGTPISNTVAEMFTMQRYLQEPLLEQVGLDTFDSWAATFGQTVDNMELGADGRTFQPVTSFSKFVNIPELVGLYCQYRRLSDGRHAQPAAA
jgi:N12 class adenine-specific DNA methylase